MKRAFPKSPQTVHLLGALFFLLFSLTGARNLAPGEIVQQEGVAYRVEGLQLQKVGELYRAAAAFRQAIYVKPDYAEAYNDLGVVLESLGDLEQAEESYKAALKFKPDMGSAHSNLALLYEESNRVKEAAVHWAIRIRLGPSGDPWVVAAREKLTKYQLPVPKIEPGTIQRSNTQTSRTIETMRVPKKSEGIRWWRRPFLGAENLWEKTQSWFSPKEPGAAGNKQAARELKELEKARLRAADAERKARDAEIQWRMEAAKRIEAESLAERIESQDAGGGNLKELERARRQVEKAAQRAADAERRAMAARKAADAARLTAETAGQTYRAAKQSFGTARRTEEVARRTEPRVSAVPPSAQALAREIVKEKSEVRGRTSGDLIQRATVAMREGLYQDAVEIYKQILILEPDNRGAKQGLERAQKALAKAAQ